MPKPKGTHWVVTAGFTDDGAPAFLRADGGWSRTLNDAQPIETDTHKDELLAAALKQEVLVSDPYAIQVCITPQGLDPLSARETIRAQGPTTPLRRPDPKSTATP